MLATLINVVVPVFATVGLGYAWVKSGRPYDRQMAGDLVTTIAAPALIFSNLAVITLEPAIIGSVALAAFIAIAFAGSLGFALLRMLRLDWRAFTPSMMIANVGNIGLPVCLLAFGERGLAIALVYFVATVLVNFTVTILISAHGEPWRRQLLLPAIFVPTLIIALAFSLTQTTPPAWLLNTTSLVGDLAIPLMLLTLGASIAALPVTKPQMAVGLAALRFGLGLGGGILAATLLGLTGEERAVVILQSAMPVAVINFVFAAKYGRSPADVASLIIVSTLMALVTVPLMLTVFGP